MQERQQQRRRASQARTQAKKSSRRSDAEHKLLQARIKKQIQAELHHVHTVYHPKPTADIHVDVNAVTTAAAVKIQARVRGTEVRKQRMRTRQQAELKLWRRTEAAENAHLQDVNEQNRNEATRHTRSHFFD